MPRPYPTLEEKQRQHQASNSTSPSWVANDDNATTSASPVDSLTSESSPSGEHEGIGTSQPIRRKLDETSQEDPAGKILNDLSNFIPLGSLTCFIQPSDQGLRDVPRGEYVEIFDLPCKFLTHQGTAESLRALIKRRWIRLFIKEYLKPGNPGHPVTIRVYVLPDDVGRAHLDRGGASARQHLMRLVRDLDASLKAWDGYHDESTSAKRDTIHYSLDSKDDESLFYVFNTIPSPEGFVDSSSCPHTSDALRDFQYDERSIDGLKTSLYPYQKRTVTAMLSRESEPRRNLDPRLQESLGPTGAVFYYDSQTGALLRDRRDYEDPCGGILGESMGLGKTLICLSLILLTRGHWPIPPPQYTMDQRQIRETTGSLSQMAAAAVVQARIPWRPYFQRLADSGEDFRGCVATLARNHPTYTVPVVMNRSRRIELNLEGKKMHLCSTTLVIVPRNLLSQWTREVDTHLEPEALRMLIADDLSDEGTYLPRVEEIVQYDIILMSRHRLEQELTPSESDQRFFSGSYQSPLRSLHLLRVIMDEGHEFASYGGKNNTYWSLQKLSVDRKWIVSGTPASGLIGVEVETAAIETRGRDARTTSSTHDRELALERRRKESTLAQEKKDLEKLGGIVGGFLKVQPWANAKDEDPASWSKYILPGKDGQRKPRSLRSLMESLVVRHRIGDIEADLKLPPLHNKVVYLEPSWHDKLSINLFVLTLVVNAITSERIDEDYMYHPKNRQSLNQLITNLRMSGFYWTSFTVEGVSKTLDVARKYMEEHASTDLTEDLRLLGEAISTGEKTLNCASWKALCSVHEMGMFVDKFPGPAIEQWSLVQRNSLSEPLLIGSTQLVKAQQWTDSHLYLTDPIPDLAKTGTLTTQRMWAHVQSEQSNASSLGTSPSRSKKRMNSESTGEPRIAQKHTVSRAKASPGTRKVRKISAVEDVTQSFRPETNSTTPSTEPALKSALKKTADIEGGSPAPWLPDDSPLAATSLLGTASTKLSYLLDRVIALHMDEKILIFYEGDHIAYYLAQAFDLVSIRYLIYTSSLSQLRQSAYITTFNTTPTFRVLLMNVHQAAHGLHIASASRVFFVNPVWQPNVEAQAIKRAHRIGQTRPVYIETLVLRDTIEDQMLQRRKAMTATEHHKAERSLLDDDRMSDIIKDARFIPLPDHELKDVNGRVARLSEPQRLFGRQDRPTGDVDDPDADLVFPPGMDLNTTRRRR